MSVHGGSGLFFLMCIIGLHFIGFQHIKILQPTIRIAKQILSDSNKKVPEVRITKESSWSSTKIEIFQSVLLRNATVWPFSKEVKQKQEPSFDILWLAARSWSYSYSRSSRTEFTGIEDDTWYCITERYFEMFNNLLSLQGRHSQGFFRFKGQDPHWLSEQKVSLTRKV